MKAKRHDSGFALLMIIILLAIGATVSLSYVGASSLRMVGSVNMTQFVRCRYLAEAGVEHAAGMLLESGDAGMDGTVYGPYTLDDSGDTYEYWGVPTGNPGEYLLSGRGHTGDLVKEVSGVLLMQSGGRGDITDYGPLAYWEMEETSGTICNDTMGNYNGQYKNGVDLAVGGAFPDETVAGNYDGNNDYVDVGTGMEISGDELTVIAWVQGDSSGGSEDTIACQSAGVGNGQELWSLSTKSGNRNPTFRIRAGSGSKQLKAGFSMADGQWYFVAAVYDGSYMRIYVDGEEVDNRTNSGNLQTDEDAEVWLGAQPVQQVRSPWEGDIDDDAVFSKALTAEEIRELYEGTSGGVEWRAWND